MKRKSITIAQISISLVFMLAFTSGCQELITEVEAPMNTSKVAAFVVLSNTSDVHSGYVSLSEPIFSRENEDKEIINGRLIVRSPRFADTFEQISETYELLNTIPFVPGDRYEMIFQSDDFSCTASAICPDSMEGIKASYSKREVQDEVTYSFDVSWEDDPDTRDYYVVTILVEDNFSESYELTYTCVDDLNNVNGRVRAIHSIQYWGELFGDRFAVYVSRVDEAFFRHQRALLNYDPDFPFNEPSPLASNMSSGLGYFTVNMSDSIQLEIR